MNGPVILLQIINSLSFSMLLFLFASGFSLIFGVMKVVNLTHGSFYLLASYVGLTVLHRTGSFLLALLVAPLLIAAIGAILERFFLRKHYNNPLTQVLMTFGFLFIFSDLAEWIWGGAPMAFSAPALLRGSVEIFGLPFPVYRFFVIFAGVSIAVGLGLLQGYTKLGALVRAAIDNKEISQGIGVNVPLLLTSVFAFGALLAGFSGVVGGPFIGVYPGMDFEILLLAFVVVIIGGMGSLKGALVGSLLVGFLDNFGKAYFPEYAFFTIFAPMAIILAIRPTGLFGRE